MFALQGASAFGVNVGSAPIHALGLGFMRSMLVGFVSRVTFGHSGRPMQVSNVFGVLYLGLHLAALWRVAPSVLEMPALLTLSATSCLLLLICWAAMMLPVYLKARVDGQRG